MRLSLVLPCYNEAKSLRTIVQRILSLCDVCPDLEIILVDDASTDESWSIAQSLAVEWHGIKVVRHKCNRGKGAALRTGFQIATGDFVGVQDADMEYDPRDYLRMLRYAEENHMDVVFGSRYLLGESRRVLRWWHSGVNHVLTTLSNMFSDLMLTDMETCYKLFRRNVLEKITPFLKEDRFGFEPEITAHIARLMRYERIRIGEVAIAYDPRTFMEGKKIGWRDGVRAIWCILRYNAPVMPVPVQILLYGFMLFMLISIILVWRSVLF